MAKEKSPEPTRKGADVEPMPTTFGTYSTVFLESKLGELTRGELKLSGINNQEFSNFIVGFGILKLQRELAEIKKELGL